MKTSTMWQISGILVLLTTVISLGSGSDMGDIMKKSCDRAQDRVMAGVKATEHARDGSSASTMSPGELFKSLRRPSAGAAANQSRAAEIVEQTIIDLQDQGFSYSDLSDEQRLELLALAGCTDERTGNIDCSNPFHDKYRSVDGTCNHRDAPLLGATLTEFSRLEKYFYENGVNEPRGWNDSKLYDGYKLPSPRSVSIHVLSSETMPEDPRLSEMLMQWGQFLDHDLTLAPEVVAGVDFDHLESCEETCENRYPCFPIHPPEDDPRIHDGHCMGSTRSAGTCSIDPSKPYARQQFNAVTTYLDASNVYGSSAEENELLRGADGYLKVGNKAAGGKHYLPYNLDNDMCLQPDDKDKEVPCFLAGDKRVNEQLALLSMHTIWMREHNRIVDGLREVQKYENAEILYNEARKIVGAEMQIITYQAWLPKILGPSFNEDMGPYKGFDPNVDPRIFNEFSAAAFRFGHGLVRPMLKRLDSQLEADKWGNIELHKAFFSPWRMVEEGGVDPLLMGLIGIPSKMMLPSNIMTAELTEKLFALAHQIALDLGALNIMRGRDHGIPTYNEMRVHCGLKKAVYFHDLSAEIPADVRDKLEKVYHTPANIDLWAGAMSENAYKGGVVGRTFRCILLKQFQVLRDGDRFWYQNEGVFTKEQVAELEKATLGRVICDNGDNIVHVQEDVFLGASVDDMVKCQYIPSIDLSKWSDADGKSYCHTAFSCQLLHVSSHTQCNARCCQL